MPEDGHADAPDPDHPATRITLGAAADVTDQRSITSWRWRTASASSPTASAAR